MSKIIKEKIIAWVVEHKIIDIGGKRTDGFSGNIAKYINQYRMIPMTNSFNKNGTNILKTDGKAYQPTILLSVKPEFVVSGEYTNKKGDKIRIFLGIEDESNKHKSWERLLEKTLSEPKKR